LELRQILSAATTIAAEALGLRDVTGSITTGLDADLVALEGDPLLDFDAYTRPRVVVTRGRVVDLGPALNRPTGARDGSRGARL
jgi:imidazolonepropionase-like amidohydrolase